MRRMEEGVEEQGGRVAGRRMRRRQEEGEEDAKRHKGNVYVGICILSPRRVPALLCCLNNLPLLQYPRNILEAGNDL